jgi:DNA-binding Lrp family transcriptional regulator
VLESRYGGVSAVTDLKLDEIDRRILAELQADGRITNIELARRAGISPPPCLRRVRALEKAGFIHGYHARLNAKLLGHELTAFAMVGLSSQSEADLAAFAERVRGWSIVRECYMMSGEVDFILKCLAPDLHTFQTFVIRDLTAAPNVNVVKTALSIREVKSEGGVPLE